jgi:hypothetical protein
MIRSFAINAYFGLDIAPSRYFSEFAHQLPALFGNRELHEQPRRIQVRRSGHDGRGMRFTIKRIFDSDPIDGAA